MPSQARSFNPVVPVGAAVILRIIKVFALPTQMELAREPGLQQFLGDVV